MVGLLYDNVFARMCAITCVSRKKPTYGVKFWYKLLLRMLIIVMVYGSFFATGLAHSMAV